MLYKSTRSNKETYTAQHALCSSRTEDGGLFVPVCIPQYSDGEIQQLLHLSETEAIAKILNQLFATTISSRDIEFLVGREILRMGEFHYRIHVAELWHNPDGDFARTVRILAGHLCADKQTAGASLWGEIAVNIALIFAVFTRLSYKTEADLERKQDIVVPAEAFVTPMAAWYARKMGLPIGTIICCCNENGNVWDLIQRGQMKLDGALLPTNTPKCDVIVPEAFELLLYEIQGEDAAKEFALAVDARGNYTVNATAYPLLKRGMYASVVGQKRLLDIIPNVYSATGYVLCPYSALTYSGLMDYRAMSGENGPALMISKWSPLHCKDTVAKAMGISTAELRQRIKEM